MRLFLVLLVGMLWTCSAYAQVEAAPASATDVNVINTPAVRVLEPIEIKPDENAPPLVTESAPLEETQTFADMLTPWDSFRQTFENYSIGTHAGICPTSTMNLFGKNVQLDAHCKIFSDVSGFLASTLLVVYSVVALVIVLKA